MINVDRAIARDLLKGALHQVLTDALDEGVTLLDDNIAEQLITRLEKRDLADFLAILGAADD